MAERRDAQPAEGRGSAGRAPRRHGRPRDRDQRQPDSEQLPPDARQPAGSLRTITGREHDREALLATLLARLEHHYDAWRGGGLAALYSDLGARDFLRGRRVTVDGLTGTALGMDRAGRLVLDVGGEQRLVESGEVSYS